ncbi:FadR/GntR family transcriptional regulator [Olivibacter domesticus]|uniref:DNA-binding transcriptional regulator, FadR family n=1 Tax=Olivibacter domesticus TaxID=407022 RepID=A0A1H7Q0Q0_OLID1|nr:GntR family transcriptional regulator [Olivibacter domesticus]SEL41304.1 DNA-binding transcriptional regulator, FadR family [Olivibacter domesticus]
MDDSKTTVKHLEFDLPKLNSLTMADQVELKLREYFKKKAFKPGDLLPKELEIAASLGVSRNIVREALSRLKALGLIETKKKRGMVLAEPDILGSFEKVLDPLIMPDSILYDIFGLRLVLEMGLADVLFMYKTEKDLRELEKIVAKEKPDSEKFRIKNEIAFHGKLYSMTNNDTLKRFQNMLLPLFDYVVAFEKDHYKPGGISHSDLVQILKTGSIEEFRNGMRIHLEPHFAWLEHIKNKEA